MPDFLHGPFANFDKLCEAANAARPLELQSHAEILATAAHLHGVQIVADPHLRDGQVAVLVSKGDHARIMEKLRAKDGKGNHYPR